MKVYRPSIEMLDKLNKVIQSCTTTKQLAGARKYCDLFCNSLPESKAWDIDQWIENVQLKSMLNKAINDKYLELMK